MQSFWGSGVIASAYDFLTNQNHWGDQIARMVDFAPDLPASPRVLDLGAGPGISAFVLARRLGPTARITGIDFSDKMVAIAREHHRERYADLTGVEFLQADATAMPFAGASFDLAVGHSFLYLTNDRPAVLREVFRVLAPGGTLVLMEPSAEGSLVRAGMETWRQGALFLTRPLATAKFVTSMITWRAVVAQKGAKTLSGQANLMRDAGFVDVACVPTLGGLGMHAVGRHPGNGK